MPTAPQSGGHALILYDGVCGLCNGFVQFVLRRDAVGYFRFCALQDPISAEILVRHNLNPATLSTVCLVTDPWTPQEQLATRSKAVLMVLCQLGATWRWAAALLRLIPRPLRDFGYSLVARIRHRIFGHLAACPLPTASQRGRFLPSA